MRGRVALIVALVAGAVLGVAARASAQEVTTSTIIPIAVFLDVDPTSGPPATVVTVRGGQCTAALTGNFATLSFEGVDRNIVVDAQGSWSTTLTIPNDAVLGDEFTIAALCANETTTVFRYFPASFTVAATAPSSTSATTVTTVMSPPLGAASSAGAPTVAPTVGPTAELPHTGANDPTGVAALAISLVGAGGLLVLSRRFRR